MNREAGEDVAHGVANSTRDDDRPAATRLDMSLRSVAALPQTWSQPSRLHSSPLIASVPQPLGNCGERFQRASLNGPLSEMFGGMRGEIGGETFQLPRSIVSHMSLSSQRPWTIPYPCISADLAAIEQSLKMVLDDLNRNHFFRWQQHVLTKAIDKRWMQLSQLKEVLACDVCARPMKNPCASLVCVHAYCCRCIMASATRDGEKNCPVEGCGSVREGDFHQTSLGHDPFSLDNPTVVRDDVLANLIKKVLNKGESDQEEEAIEDTLVPNLEPVSTRVEDLGPLRCIRARTQGSPMRDIAILPVVAQAEPDPGEEILREETEYMTVAVFPVENDDSLFEIDDNYFYVPSSLTVCQFSGYLENRFQLTGLRFFCNDVCISLGVYEETTLLGIHKEFWSSHPEGPDDVLTLRYSHEPLQLMDTSV